MLDLAFFAERRLSAGALSIAAASARASGGIADTLAAHAAYSSGLDTAMVVGAVLAAFAAVGVHLALRPRRSARDPQARVPGDAGGVKIW